MDQKKTGQFLKMLRNEKKLTQEQLAKKLGKGKRVVTVLPDTAERYFSTPLFYE